MNILEDIENCLSESALKVRKIKSEIIAAKEYGLDVDSLDQDQLKLLLSAHREVLNSLSLINKIYESHIG